MILPVFDDFYTVLGANIRTARINATINQDVLAQQLNLTRASIVNIEKGRQRPLIHTLLQIASVLKVNLTDLLPQPTSASLDKTNNGIKDNATDFDHIISDEFVIDQGTKDSVKKFVTNLKR